MLRDVVAAAAVMMFVVTFAVWSGALTGAI